MNKIDRLPQTVFVDPEKVKSVHIGTERIQLSKKR